MFEQRTRDLTIQQWMNNLTDVQKFASSGLESVGYELAFIRGAGEETLAVYILDDKVATINADGDVDYQANIDVRIK